MSKYIRVVFIDGTEEIFVLAKYDFPTYSVTIFHLTESALVLQTNEGLVTIPIDNVKYYVEGEN